MCLHLPLGAGLVHLADTHSLRCRYQAYLEAKAWSTSLKQKLACGSVILTPRMEVCALHWDGLCK